MSFKPFVSKKRAKAVYQQKSQDYNLSEVSMIRSVTKRQVIENELIDYFEFCSKNECASYTMKSIHQLFKLLNDLREITIEVILKIYTYHQEFCKPQSVRLLILGNMDFVGDCLSLNPKAFNSTNFKKIFGFYIGYGNILLLPFPSHDQPNNVDIDIATGEEIHRFSSPSYDQLIQIYQILLNFTADSTFNKLVPLQTWINKPWNPSITVKTSLLPSSLFRCVENNKSIASRSKPFKRRNTRHALSVLSVVSPTAAYRSPCTTVSVNQSTLVDESLSNLEFIQASLISKETSKSSTTVLPAITSSVSDRSNSFCSRSDFAESALKFPSLSVPKRIPSSHSQQKRPYHISSVDSRQSEIPVDVSSELYPESALMKEPPEIIMTTKGLNEWYSGSLENE